MASIERIKVNDETIFVIHNNGKRKTLTSKNNIKKLLEICHKHNRYFGKNNTLENTDIIIKEFDSYINQKNKQKKKLKIMYDNINKLSDKIKLVKRLTPKGKIIVTATLATTIGITSLGISSLIKDKKNTPGNEPYITIEELPEYIDDFKNIEMSTPSITIDDISDELIESINTDTVIEIDNNELNEMLEENNEFHFSYTDRTNEESLKNAKRYEDLFEKYGNMYGIDPNLLMAMAAQESSGNHYDHLKGNYGIGIMQIEKGVHLNTTLKAYNFETGEIDSIKVTEENIKDLETNIQMGTIILRNNIEANNYNIPLALQTYNLGPGNMSKVISNASDATGLLKNDIKDNTTNPEWLNYRNTVHAGDSKYIEHVFSYIKSGTTISVKDRDGNSIQQNIVNDEVNIKQIA